MSTQKSVVIVGDGWAALGAVGSLLTSQKDTKVHWIAGAGSRVISPLPSLESSAAETVIGLCTRLGIELGDKCEGNFLREFKNKAYREPTWTQGDEAEARKQTRTESLWDPERVVPNLFETRFELTLAEIEEQIREKLTTENFPTLTRVEGKPLAGIRIEKGTVTAAQLASGEEIACSSLIYADRWTSLAKIAGLPKSLGFTRRRDPHGVLQATFSHATPVGLEVLEGFFGAMNRESGEEYERHVWGYFSSNGKRSFWTICLSAEEVEDNHEIAKKLRRMKSTLDKMFVGSSWVPNQKPDQTFMSNVSDEQVRFEESSIFASGDAPTETVTVPGIEGLAFLTDGYGPSSAFQQVRTLLGDANPSPQAEDSNKTDAT